MFKFEIKRDHGVGGVKAPVPSTPWSDRRLPLPPFPFRCSGSRAPIVTRSRDDRTAFSPESSNSVPLLEFHAPLPYHRSRGYRPPSTSPWAPLLQLPWCRLAPSSCRSSSLSHNSCKSMSQRTRPFTRPRQHLYLCAPRLALAYALNVPTTL